MLKFFVADPGPGSGVLFTLELGFFEKLQKKI